jgi:endonuclease/exonuclease/phosphatase (EEP) superfamily protein YafD
MDDLPRPISAQLRRAAQLVLFLVAAATGVATVVAWLSRWWLVGELASHFRVQYFWAGLITTLALAALRCWWLAGLAALPVLVNLALIVPLYLPGVKADVESPALRIAEINVYYGNPRHDDVLRFIADTKPDVVLLLEVTDAWRDLFEALQDDYPFQKLALHAGNFGIALVSRLPFDSVAVEELGEAKLPTIIAELTWDSKPVTIVGTHPLPPARARNWRMRNDQFAALARRCQSIVGATILIGDLNSTDWSAHFDTLLDGTSLRDSRCGFGVQPSWPQWSVLARISIDHCLVTPELAVRNRFIGPDVGSDHFPLVVDLTLIGK